MAWVDDHDFREDVPARASVFDGEFPLHFLLQTKLLLAYLDLFDATAIRAVCRELRDAVTESHRNAQPLAGLASTSPAGCTE